MHVQKDGCPFALLLECRANLLELLLEGINQRDGCIDQGIGIFFLSLNSLSRTHALARDFDQTKL